MRTRGKILSSFSIFLILNVKWENFQLPFFSHREIGRLLSHLIFRFSRRQNWLVNLSDLCKMINMNGKIFLIFTRHLKIIEVEDENCGGDKCQIVSWLLWQIVLSDVLKWNSFKKLLNNLQKSFLQLHKKLLLKYKFFIVKKSLVKSSSMGCKKIITSQNFSLYQEKLDGAKWMFIPSLPSFEFIFMFSQIFLPRLLHP